MIACVRSQFLRNVECGSMEYQRLRLSKLEALLLLGVRRVVQLVRLVRVRLTDADGRTGRRRRCHDALGRIASDCFFSAASIGERGAISESDGVLPLLSLCDILGPSPCLRAPRVDATLPATAVLEACRPGKLSSKCTLRSTRRVSSTAARSIVVFGEDTRALRRERAMTFATPAKTRDMCVAAVCSGSAGSRRSLDVPAVISSPSRRGTSPTVGSHKIERRAVWEIARISPTKDSVQSSQRTWR